MGLRVFKRLNSLEPSRLNKTMEKQEIDFTNLAENLSSDYFTHKEMTDEEREAMAHAEMDKQQEEGRYNGRPAQKENIINPGNWN